MTEAKQDQLVRKLFGPAPTPCLHKGDFAYMGQDGGIRSAAARAAYDLGLPMSKDDVRRTAGLPPAPSLRLYEPPATLDATDYIAAVHGRRVDVEARVRVTGLWRVRLAEVLVRTAGRLLKARYTLKTVLEDV